MDNNVYEREYFNIKEIKLENRKTPIYEIYSKHSNDCIGVIKWYGAWRKFCFFPCSQTIWDNKCLIDVVDFTASLNNNYFKKNK